MNIIDLATKTMQTAIKGVIDAIKVKVDTIDTRTTTTNTSVNTVNTNLASAKAVIDNTKTQVDAIDIKVGTLLNGRIVKSIQTGLFTLNASSLSATITPIDKSKSFLTLTYNVTDLSTSPFPNVPRGKIASNSELQFFRATSGNSYPTLIEWQVIEFY